MTVRGIFLTVFFCITLQAQTNKACAEQSRVVIGSNYLTNIDAVITSKDGWILIGNPSGIKKFDPAIVPAEFLTSWGIEKSDIEAIHHNFLEKKKKEWQAESEGNRALKEKILRNSPNLQFPFIASKPIVLPDDIIHRGESFTVIPFRDESMQSIRLRTIIKRVNGDWQILDRNTGIPLGHYDDIELQTNQKQRSNSYYRVINKPRTGYRTVTYTSRAENTFSRKESYKYSEFFLTASGTQSEADAMAYVVGVSGRIITDTFLVKGDEEFSIGTNDKHAKGPRVNSNKWIFISQKGTISTYPN